MPPRFAQGDNGAFGPLQPLAEQIPVLAANGRRLPAGVKSSIPDRWRS
jgi:hypothetical protein